MSANLFHRIGEIHRTVNHTLRKELGVKMFGGVKSSKKFDAKTEKLLDEYFKRNLFVRFLLVNFGRLEIESHLINTYQNQLYNSKKKRQ